MGNFWNVPLLHSVSDVPFSYEYDNVALDVVKGGAFLEPTTIAAARPGNRREVSIVLVPATEAQVFGDVLPRGCRQSFPAVGTKD
jgi:hypothetical protein